MKPVVAIVGRPNVGKSTLFNRLIGKRKALVSDIPGLTRDRIYQDAIWKDREFTLVDTGGFNPFSQDRILQLVKHQAELAIYTADVILFILEPKTGVTAEDKIVSKILHKNKKPVILVINKQDTKDSLVDDILFYTEFQRLGFKDFINISALHGLNINTLLDKLLEYLPSVAESFFTDSEKITRIAVVGKPNVGKSSLVNVLLNQERVIVTETPGTTRDAIDTYFEKDNKKYILIDTAGIKRAKETKDLSTILSIISAQKSIQQADIALLVLDAEAGFNKQDQRIAHLVYEAGCACIILLNKWDLVEKPKDSAKFFEYIQFKLDFLHYAPIMPVSAKTRENIDHIFLHTEEIKQKYTQEISESTLKDILQEAQAKHPPPLYRRQARRFYAIKQIKTAPPVFLINCNFPEEIPSSYYRYLENRIRENFDLKGVPLKIIFRKP